MLDNFLRQLRENLINGTYHNISGAIEKYAYVFLISALNLLIGFLIAFIVYKIIMYLFKKFKIVAIIDRITMISIYKDQKKEVEVKKISDNIKIDVITAKSMSYYIFLLFFRYSIVIIGITDVEVFLDKLINYLPSLFIGVIVGFFGIRFANFVYDLIYYPLDLSNQKNAEIIAMGGKIIILFFTMMVVLSQIGIGTDITNIILIGFVGMLSLAGGLAFGLGGKDIARDILESFKDGNKKK
ncbi:hypothetical protein BLD25_01515 [Candidatus Gracilibacteria bacterium GN02-872]|nr:hypothetical protein BLD25_01515 [Candidatus Gracilibacteria bacterium GN02-872]